MHKERTDIPVKSIRQNNGQLAWLPKNPRQWTQTDIDRTVRSIEEDTDFLEDRPVLLVPGPKEGQYIAFAGNLRYTAAKKLDLQTVPAVVYHPETDEDFLTVKRRAMKDNGTFGAWDMDELANRWSDLPLPDWGVPVPDFEDLPEDKPEVVEDEMPDADGILVRCKPGDIWQLGEHRLMCGDSTDLETVKKLMGGGMADLLLTDPPYNVDYSSKNEYLNKYGKGNRVQTDIENDKMSDRDFSVLLDESFGNAATVLKSGGAFYVWTTQGHAQKDIADALDRASLLFRQQIVWVKNNMVLGRMDYQGKHEPCFYGWKEGAGHYFKDSRSETTTIEEDKPLQSKLHPTMKPVALFARLIENSTREGESVLDLFGGSGTTLIAAEQLKRRCYMMELDPHYCDVILARWETLTGKTAQLITPGEKAPEN